MIYIIAGSAQQAHGHAREEGLPRPEYHYVLSARDLAGLRGVKIKFVGTWHDRPDAQELEMAAELAQQVRCEICGEPTIMFATKRCDRCWELQRRISAAPGLARKILAKLGE